MSLDCKYTLLFVYKILLCAIPYYLNGQKCDLKELALPFYMYTKVINMFTRSNTPCIIISFA